MIWNENYGNHESEDFGDEMRIYLERKFLNFIHHSMSRQMRLAKKLDRCLWNEKDLERCRRFYKNKHWADYCQNRRYELAGL